MFEDANLISVYTRAQAIEDGTLINLTDATDRDGRRLSPFKWPVAMTATAFGATISAGGEWKQEADGDETLDQSASSGPFDQAGTSPSETPRPGAPESGAPKPFLPPEPPIRLGSDPSAPRVPGPWDSKR